MRHLRSWEAEVGPERTVGRRELLTRTVPACAMACLGLGGVDGLLAADGLPEGPGTDRSRQEVHKFDAKRAQELSSMDLTRMQNRAFMDFIKVLRPEIGDGELIRILRLGSAEMGRRIGEMAGERAPDRTFRTFTAQFRPPRFADTLTHEVVEDTDDAFAIRVTECVWAAVFREAGLAGEIGNAAICNMDYHTPVAFNPNIRMERDRTLMQGHDHCNHRYVLETEGA